MKSIKDEEFVGPDVARSFEEETKVRKSVNCNIVNCPTATIGLLLIRLGHMYDKQSNSNSN